MSSPRVAPVQPPYTDDLQKSFDVVMPEGVPPLNIFRTVGRNPRVLSRMVRGGLLDRGSITISDRELVILRACAACNAEYEWGVHAAIYGKKTGFSEQQIAATWSNAVEPDLWSEAQQVLLAMVDALHSDACLPDALWTELTAHYDEEQLVELVMLAGLYHAVSFVVNAFRVENETFALSALAGVPAALSRSNQVNGDRN